MSSGVFLKALPIAVVGLAVAAAATMGILGVSSSGPGDLTYGTKLAAAELRTALTPDGAKKSDRYLDEADMMLAELTLLVRNGAPPEDVAETAERAVTTERHAQAERSRQDAPETSQRYERHRQKLQRTLRTTKQPVVWHSVRQMLEIAIPKQKASGR